jgi:hypothetical protein
LLLLAVAGVLSLAGIVAGLYALLPYLPALVGIGLAIALFTSLGKVLLARRYLTSSQLVASGAGIASLGILLTVWLAFLATRAPAQTPRPTPVTTPTPAPETVPPLMADTVDTFGKAYSDNVVALRVRYQGKRIALRGRVENIGGTAERASLLLRGETTYSAIYCRFNERTSRQVATLQQGQIVAVAGTFDGGVEEVFGSRMGLDDSALMPLR